MEIPREMAERIVAHAREDLPNECCGIVASRDGEVVHLYRAINIHHSPLRFEIDSNYLLRILGEIEEGGLTLASIYHSHIKSPAYPSQTDINFAELWPGVVWLIVSLEDPDNPDLRAFQIVDGSVDEVGLTISGD